MDIEVSMSVVKPCNFARKRQAVLESCTEQHLKKRPCLQDSSWHTENMSNLETENRLIYCMQPAAEVPSHTFVCKQPLTDPSSTVLDVQVDLNCNIIDQGSNFEEMEVSYEANITQSQAQLHQLRSSIPSMLMTNRSSLPACSRCLTGEPGHINHLSS